MRIGKLVSAGALVAATSLLLAACGSSTSPSSSVIKIGVPVPLSGPYASAGTDIVDGAKLAAANINAKGGVLGQKIVIVPADDACDPQTGVQAAQKLVAQGVVGIAGGYCSSAAIPESGVFHQTNLPFVADASTNPTLTEQGFNDVFRTIGRDDEQGPFAANFIANFLHAKRVVVMDDNTTYAAGLAQNTITALKKYGVAVDHIVITAGQSDYTAALTSAAQFHPQVLYYTGYFTEAGLLVKQAKQLHLSFQFMGGDATNSPVLFQTAGAAANGMIITTSPLAQFLGGAQGYVTQYTKKFGQAPGPYSVYEYDAVGVLAQAIKNAGSTNAVKIDKALHAIQNYQGATGVIGFNKIGDRTHPAYITIRVENDQFLPYMLLTTQGTWAPAK